jgi:uncharacterized protein (TIGR03435 family)
MSWLALTLAILSGWSAVAQTPRPSFDAFDVATIKPISGDEKGRYLKLEGANRFIAVAYPVKLLVAAAYDLNPKTISGGPAWMNEEKWNIEARTPGTLRPTHDEQMRMLRALLADRFGLKFHRESRDFSIFAITIARGGAKLNPAGHPDDPPVMGPAVVYTDKIVLPARNATIGEMAQLLQRAILDRPVVDRTGLTARYDFDLEWAPDESEFGGDAPKMAPDATALPLFEAVEKQLGLKMEATKGAVQAMVVDSVVRPSAN